MPNLLTNDHKVQQNIHLHQIPVYFETGSVGNILEKTWQPGDIRKGAKLPISKNSFLMKFKINV